MKNNKLPAVFIFLLIVGTVACSLISGVFIVPAIIFFAVLCIAAPSPFLALAPLVSIIASVFLSFPDGFEAVISSCAMSITYLLPSLLIAVGYFKKQSKFMVIINGAIGIFIYICVIIIVAFLLRYGEFNSQVLNAAIDARLENYIEAMYSQLGTLQAGDFSVTRDTFEQIFHLSKPLFPAYIAMLSLITSYIAVCCTNVLLKKMKIIENKNYRIMPHWTVGIVFIVCMMFTTLGGIGSFASVIAASVTMIFLPIFTITGTGVVYDVFLRIFKNKVTAVISFSLLIIISLVGVIIYNLFYLIGAYYSIITGIKNTKFTSHKGGR